jgi:Lon protease-like protein
MPARAMPMFPLGTVLFPYGVLPLHVFEPRYRALVDACLAAPDGPEFGVVLIERGSEVGGGDTRVDVGTVARIVEASRFDDGRYALATVGTRRLRVVEWLPDDPYPQAMVETIDEPAMDAADAVDARAAVEQRLRRVLGLASELGAAVRPDVELDADPARAGFEACALAPLGPFDAQQLLEVDDPRARLDRLVVQLDDLAELLELRLAEG